MSATVMPIPPALRIGEVAKRVGTTPRTIRYYEEIGILPSEGGREAGRHRLYGEREVQRLSDALRLKELLGVSLDELRELLEAEDTRAALRDEWRHGDPGTERRRQMLAESQRLIDRQLALVRRRRDEIAALEDELVDKRRLVARRMRELDAE
jgi:MerR family transcriptional regulator, repressor of the yfmOP operon